MRVSYSSYYGFYWTEESRTCYKNNDRDEDESLGVARAFGLISTVIGGIALLFMLILPLKSPSKKILTTMFFALCPLQLVTFSAFGSNICPGGGCALASGANLAVTASVLWLLSAICVMKMRVSSSTTSSHESGNDNIVSNSSHAENDVASHSSIACTNTDGKDGPFADTAMGA